MTAATATTRQLGVLEFIRDWHQVWGYTPTRAEIAEGMGWKSPNAAEDHVQALERRGFLERHRGIARGLRITDAGRRLLLAGRIHGSSPLPAATAPDFIALPVVDMAKLNLQRSPA